MGGSIGGRVRGELLGKGTTTVRPLATEMSQRMERSESPLAACSSTGPRERSTQVDGNGFYTAVGES